MSVRIAFNIVVGLCGFILTAMGFFILYTNYHNYNFSEFFYLVGIVNVVSLFNITCGIITLTLALVDLVKICNKHPFSRILFVHWFLSVFFMTTLVFVVLFIMDKRGVINTNIDNVVKTSMSLFNESSPFNDDIQRKRFGQIQCDFTCCGHNSFFDWKESKQFNSNRTRLITPKPNQITFNMPDSCCVQSVRKVGCGKRYPMVYDIEVKGCLQAIVEFKNKLLKNEVYSSFWAILGFSFFSFFASMFLN